jgi:hypothetical protein
MNYIYFDLENENGFFCLFFFLLSTYIYACKKNKILCIKDDKWKFLYENGLNDYLQLPENIIKYDFKNHNETDMFTHMKEPPMMHTLQDYKKYSKILYKVRTDILKIYDLPINYNSIFIRGGDKLLYESTQIPIEHYVSFLLNLQSDTNNLFIHSDDNLLVESVEQYIKDNHIPLCIYKITDHKNNGGAVVMKRLRYGNCKNIISLDEMNKDEIKEHILKMLNAIEIMRNSKNVIVSYDSNVSRFMKINFDCNVYSVNHNNLFKMNIPVKNPAYSF